jgi:TonB family protein
MRRLLMLLIAVPVVLSANALQDKPKVEDPPKVIKRVDPVYPKPIPKDSAEGMVFVELSVDSDGNVSSAKVVKAEAGEAFQKAALEAARQWKFAPTSKEKTYTLMLPFKFKLSDEKKEKEEKKN